MLALSWKNVQVGGIEEVTEIRDFPADPILFLSAGAWGTSVMAAGTGRHDVNGMPFIVAPRFPLSYT